MVCGMLFSGTQKELRLEGVEDGSKIG